MSEHKKLVKQDTIVTAYRDILQRNPKIKYQDIEYFVPIYYPIALLEMNIDEKVFEDFDIMQWTILRLLATGRLDSETIAHVTGLSQSYVSKVIRYLYGVGLINEEVVTELGRKSIEEKRKISFINVRQQFQVDALNGKPLKIEKLVSESVMNSKEATSEKIIHFNFLDVLEISNLLQQFEQTNYIDFIKSGKNILNRNIIRINEAKCSEVKYALSYLMKFSSESCPVIYAKRDNPNKVGKYKEIIYEALGVANGFDRDRYGFDDDIGTNTSFAVKRLENISSQVKKAQKSVSNDTIMKAVSNYLPLNLDTLVITNDENTGNIYIEVNSHSFSFFRKTVLTFLLEIHNQDTSIYSNEDLFGRLIIFNTNDEKLKNFMQKCADEVERLGNISKLYEKIMPYIQHFNSKNIIDGILEVLSSEPPNKLLHPNERVLEVKELMEDDKRTGDEI